MIWKYRLLLDERWECKLQFIKLKVHKVLILEDF